MLGSAFASLRPAPVRRACSPRNGAPVNRRGLGGTAGAHHRVLTLHAMIRHRALHDPQSADRLPAAA